MRALFLRTNISVAVTKQPNNPKGKDKVVSVLNQAPRHGDVWGVEV